MKAAGAILGLVSVATALHLQARVGQSPAVCMQQFSWMGTQNGMGVSPCQTVADVDAQCNAGNWVIDALNSSVHYTPPTGSTASTCTCSWASYNLLSACTACQGFPEQIPTWGAYSVGCAGQLTTDSFFPSNITLPSNVRIPFWAQTDPTQWPGQIFNVNQAQQLAAEDHPDFVGGTKSGESKKKSNAGAIAGGVVGGLVVIGAAVAIALWMIRRSRKPMGAQQLHTGAELIQRPSHMRSMSEISTFKAPENLGYANLTGVTMNGGGGGGGGLMPPMSPVQTHFTGSTRSVPYVSTVVGGASTAPYGSMAPSTPPVPRVPTPVAGGSTRIEDVVIPFTSPPSLDANMDRKNPNGAFPLTVYSDPNAPHPNTTPMRMEIVHPRTPVPRNAQRFNPPAYEASSPGGAASSSGHPGHSHSRSKQGSTDTTHSMTSSRNGMQAQTPGHSPNTSISTPGIAGQMSMLPPTTPLPAQHGRKVSASTRDVKVRPEDDAFSARNIA